MIYCSKEHPALMIATIWPGFRSSLASAMSVLMNTGGANVSREDEQSS